MIRLSRSRVRGPSKPGSILVMAVGVLAVLAVMALSYVTVVRIDRRSTDAYQRDENLQQEVIVATAWIRALLTADLFGGRVVTDTTPRLLSGVSNLPRAFEDGEYADVPWTDLNPNQPGNTLTGATYTWDTSIRRPGDLTTPQPPMSARLDPTGQDNSIPDRAFADDAWLAATQPIDTGAQLLSGDGAEWDTWPQISNLLSAYRYRNTTQFIGWARDPGRFVDLGQFLLQERPGFTGGTRAAFPGAFLELDRNQNNPWIDPLTNTENGPHLGVDQTIFDLTMADLQEEFYAPNGFTDPGIGQRTFQPADERFWADTDGDGRPDARWQELPIFGNAFGLRWVIAARITDNSALANVNSHDSSGIVPTGLMGGLNRSAGEIIGDGRTPADVDLFRLIASQMKDAQTIDPNLGSLVFSAHPDIRDNGSGTFDAQRLLDSWKFHINFGPRFGRALAQLDRLDNSNGGNALGLDTVTDNFIALGEDASFPTGSNLYNENVFSPFDLRRVERAAMWRYFGSDPFNPIASSAIAYPIRDEIDLRAFNGYNFLSFISRVEQRLDGPIPDNNNIPGFLPGLDPPYEAGRGLGPLRSKEWDNRADSPRTFKDSTFILDLGAGNYTNADKLERLRKDIRHLITTVSGEGPIGPVPVLNPAPRFEGLFSTRKVDLNRFTTPDFTINLDRIREPVQDAFAAFMWALAPLATNQPLMAPLDQINISSYARLADDADLHYGGGVTGPASAIAQDIYGLSPNAPGGADAIGAAYAFLRAGALAANLPDASDSQTPADGMTATIEEPTIVRLFNQPDIDFFIGRSPTVRDSVATSRAIALGVRFPQGDLWDDPTQPADFNVNTGNNTLALPEQVVGAPENGVTLVGLDRQPFLVHAYSAVFYANANATENVAIDPADTTLDPDDPRDLLGSFFAVELGNPWTEPLLLDGYAVRIDDGANQLVLDFNTATIAGGAVMPAGQRVVFYFFSDVSPAAAPGGAAEWATIQAELRAQFEDGGAQTREITTPAMGDALAGSAFTGNSVNFFRAFGGSPSLPVLLTRRITGSLTPFEVLMDRLSPAPGQPFPITLDGPIALDNLVQAPPIGGAGVPAFAGRAAVQSSIRRPAEPGPNGGFPSYVIERPSDNLGDTQENDTNAHGWIINEPTTPALPVTDITGSFIALGEIGLLDPAAVKGSLNVAPFELFVPDTALISTAELGLICPYAHMYIHPDQGVPSVADAWDTSGNLGPGKWATVSEQLGWDAHYFYNPQSPSTPNPYLATLDLSRYVLGASGDIDATATTVGTRIPDALTVPLATRIFDAFEALPTTDGVVRGRVNVNTAPRRILELLPLVDPRDAVDAQAVPASPSGPTLQADRVGRIVEYRTRQLNGGAGAIIAPQEQFVSGPAMTDQPGRRDVDQTVSPWSLGFVSKGEIATLANWNNPADGGFSSNPSDMGFLELAGVPNPIEIPLDIRRLVTDFEAADDPEERLAIFRAIANIASTRSDIFTVWYILRAYDPKDIEAITIPPELTNDNDIVALMNPGNPQGLPGVSEDNPGLLPAFEKRILLILDRSNVRRPTDRPRVLLQVELPLN